MNYKELTKKIKEAEAHREFAQATETRDFWKGYIYALKEVRKGE